MSDQGRAGPLAECRGDGARPRVRLTTAGRAYLEAHLAKWPHVIGFVVATMPGLFFECRRQGLTDEEIEAAALYGLVRAVCRYDSRHEAAFNTLAWYHVRSQLERSRVDRAKGRGHGSIVSAIQDRRPARDMESLDAVRHGLRFLDERQRRVVVLRYGLEGEAEHTLDECSKRLGLSRERIRQIEDRALRTMRRAMEGDSE